MEQPLLLTRYPASQQHVIEQALLLLTSRLKASSCMPQFTTTVSTKAYLQLRLATLEREVFMVLFLDNQHRLLEYETLALGTISHVEVHPREIVKSALRHNAAAVILAHNHPSGNTEASQQDKHLTRQLIQALALVDVRVLDHFIIGCGDTVSFAECGWL